MSGRPAQLGCVGFWALTQVALEQLGKSELLLLLGGTSCPERLWLLKACQRSHAISRPFSAFGKSVWRAPLLQTARMQSGE